MKCFDTFRLDDANQCLWRDQVRVALMPKPFDLLTCLVQNAGRLVTQDELLKAVWPGTHVQSDVLRKHIKEIRRVLGDDATTPRFIETVPKRGYRFAAAVWEESEEAGADLTIARQLVGRETVLAALSERSRQALAGERQMVFVTGEAGIGKTTLVNAFAQAANTIASMRVAWGQSVEGFGGKEPYYPLLEAFGRLGRGPEGGPIVETLAACAPTWLVQLPSLLPPERRASLSLDVVGATTPRMVRELCEALERITRTIPLVVVLEDLHWVDHSTLDALSAIARRRERARLLIVATCRPVNTSVSDSRLNDLRRDLCMHGLAAELPLQPLTPHEIARYVAERFSPNAFPPGLDAVLSRHSGGNPLFMSATADHLVHRRVLDWDGTCWHMTMTVEEIGLDVSDTLRHILELQVEQLTDVNSRALMCASVVGERFTSWDAATMLGSDEISADAVFDSLVRRGQFVRTADEGSAGRRQTTAYEFKHALYRDALYRRLPVTLRTTYHRRLAERLDALRAAGDEDVAGEAASHYEAAGSFDRAVTNTIAAARTALRRYAHAEALALLKQGAQLNQRAQDGARGHRSVELLEQTGDVHYAHGVMPAATDAYERAAAAAIDQRLWAAAARALLRAARSAVFFDVQRALADCERAVRVAVDGGMPGLEARARLVKLCWDLLHRGWSRERTAEAASAFRRLLESPSDLTPADHILYANVQVFRSEYAEAAARADTALSQLQDSDTLWEHLGAMAAKGGALLLLGRWGEAYDTLTAGIELARRNDNGPWLDLLTGLQGSVHIQAFDFAGARAIVSGRLPASAVGASPRSQMHLRIIGGGAELGLGHVREAVQSFSAVRTSMPGDLPIVHWYWRLQAQLGLAETAFVSGDLAIALVEASQLTAAVAGLDETMIGALAWECRARIELARNQLDAAEVSIDRAIDRLAASDAPGAAWRVHATAAAVRESTDPARAAAHLGHARTILSAVASSLDGHPPLQQSLLAVPAIHALLSS